MIIVKEKYKSCSLNFKSYPKYVDMPYIRVVLKNLQTGKIDTVSRDFLVDTGASISIINNKYSELLKETESCDKVELIFGKGKSQHYDVYKVALIIKDNVFETLVAFVPDCPFLLLGHYAFLERNSYNLFHSSIKQTRLVRN